MRHSARTLLLTALAAVAIAPAGCGVLTYRQPDFPDAETGENGQVYVLDDLEAIANDANLTTDEKIAQFHDLGIEDEDLISALLAL